MNIAFFIANRLRQIGRGKKTVSARIITIATAAVAIGTAMILITLVTVTGLQEAIENKTAAFNGHYSISTFSNHSSKLSLTPVGVPQSIKEQLRALEGVVGLEGVAYKGGLLKTDTSFEGILFKGVAATFDWSKLEDFLVQGRYPSAAQSNEILISQRLANRLALALDDRVLGYFQKDARQRVPNTRRFTVVGIYNSGFPEVDNTYVLGSIAQIQGLNKWSASEVGAYEVFAPKTLDDPKLLQTIYNSLPMDLDVIPLKEQYPSIFQWMALLDYNIIIILVVMTIVGVINMATALLIMIFERSRMIGLLKTLGSSNLLIHRIFLTNGGFILLRGLFWGNAIGLLFYFGQRYGQWITLDPITYFVEVAPVSLHFGSWLMMNLLLLGVSLLMLWFPVMIVSKISPTKTLKFK